MNNIYYSNGQAFLQSCMQQSPRSQNIDLVIFMLHKTAQVILWHQFVNDDDVKMWFTYKIALQSDVIEPSTT